MEVIKGTAKLFYNELNNIAKSERTANNTRIKPLVYTNKKEPDFQRAENLSRTYIRNGMQKFADPFPFKMKPNDAEYYDGRNLNILNSLKRNAQRDFPDVITRSPLKVASFY